MKKLNSFILILVVALSYTVLTSSQNQTTVNNKAMTNIKVWYFDTGKAEINLLAEIAKFETTNGIIVNATHIDSGTFLDEFDKVYYDNVNRPDLIQVQSNWVSSIASKRRIAPLDAGYIQGQDYLAPAIRGLSSFNPDTQNFDVYGYPYSVDTILGFANKNQFDSFSHPYPFTIDSVPTWSEWLKAATLTTDQRDVNNSVYGFSFTDTPGSFDPFLYGMGAQLFTEQTVDVLHLGISAQNQASVYALDLASSLVKERRLTPSVDEMGTENTRTLFNAGKVAMIFDYFTAMESFSNTTVFGTDNANLLNFQVPAIVEGTTGAPLVVDGFSVVSKSVGDAKTTAESLGKQLTSASLMKTNVDSYAKLPARSSVFEQKQSDRFVQAFTYAVGRAYQIPVSKYWLDSLSVYSTRSWLYLSGEPATSERAAEGYGVFMDFLPQTSNIPVYEAASFPSLFIKLVPKNIVKVTATATPPPNLKFEINKKIVQAPVSSNDEFGVSLYLLLSGILVSSAYLLKKFRNKN